MGLDSAAPRRMIPYSVSIPMTFGMAMGRPYPAGRSAATPGPDEPPGAARPLQVLAGAHPLDGPATGGFLPLGEQGADIDDPLALLAGDLRPVVRVGGVGQVLVLAVLLLDRGQHVGGADAPALAGDHPLDGQLLGPADDVLDHGAGGEVLEVED